MSPIQYWLHVKHGYYLPFCYRVMVNTGQKSVPADHDGTGKWPGINKTMHVQHNGCKKQYTELNWTAIMLQREQFYTQNNMSPVDVLACLTLWALTTLNQLLGQLLCLTILSSYNIYNNQSTQPLCPTGTSPFTPPVTCNLPDWHDLSIIYHHSVFDTYHSVCLLANTLHQWLTDVAAPRLITPRNKNARLKTRSP